MVIEISEYKDENKQEWEAFVRNSNNCTIFHTINFLEYHKDMFKNNNLIFREKGNIVALLPAVLIKKDSEKILNSHAGASFGGFVTRKISLKLTLEILDCFLNYCKSNKINSIYITLPPSIYNEEYDDHIKYCLAMRGFICNDKSLTSVINLETTNFEKFDKKTKNTIRKAEKSGVNAELSQDFKSFYDILLENKKSKNTLPTHSLNELLDLNKRIQMKLFMAYLNNKPIAGILLFVCNNRVAMTFYIAHKESYQQYRPVDLLMHNVVKWAKEQKFKYLDLGTSTTNLEPTWGLVKFKENFCSSGIFRERFYLKL